jgi:hypothetical protein
MAFEVATGPPGLFYENRCELLVVVGFHDVLRVVVGDAVFAGESGNAVWVFMRHRRPPLLWSQVMLFGGFWVLGVEAH